MFLFTYNYATENELSYIKEILCLNELWVNKNIKSILRLYIFVFGKNLFKSETKVSTFLKIIKNTLDTFMYSPKSKLLTNLKLKELILNTK